MLSALGTKRAFGVALLFTALSVACTNHWVPANTDSVPTQGDAQATYSQVLEVAAADQYGVISKDDAAKKIRLQSKNNGKTFIDIEVTGSDVKLSGAGSMVHGSKMHKNLEREIANFEADLKQRFAGGATTQVSSSGAPAPVSASGVPQAWTEPAYDPSVWGNGNFTCIPVRVPADHQGALSLQLSNGEKADLQLSLAYDQGLCRSPSQCKQAGGCPALGIGDSERVNRLAGRLSRGEVGPQAVLLDGGKPVATIDLSHHGSIVQALSEIKH